MSKITELTQKRNKIITDATALVQRGLNTPEAKESYKKMLAEADDLESDLEMLNRIERAMPTHQQQSVAPVAPIATSPENRRGKLNAAWRAYLSGRLDNSIPEHRDLLTSTSGSDGGAIVNQDFAGFVSQAQKWHAPLADYVHVRTTKAMQPTKVTKSDDRTAGLRLVTEGSGTTVFEADAAFSSTVVFHDLLSTGLTRFSNELLADSGFDLEQLLSDQAAIRYGRGLETILTRGIDSNGVVTPNNPGLINIAPIAVTTAW